jgi:hypothetical protein
MLALGFYVVHLATFRIRRICLAFVLYQYNGNTARLFGICIGFQTRECGCPAFCFVRNEGTDWDSSLGIPKHKNREGKTRGYTN